LNHNSKEIKELIKRNLNQNSCNLMNIDDKLNESNGYMKKIKRTRRCKRRVSIPFSQKLHKILEDADFEVFSHIISWLPHGIL